ncbi:photosystem II reaction center PsbP family protein [Striga asiatica]|uniref:Photosystem II reaction center PsbP family protein n=1 Tax=Striga asiatica TaxID=4170 RepID=A0A5A7PUY9_STRAF|nr:photosystem II reaction center PsbP family protein [Striga asiatica]
MATISSLHTHSLLSHLSFSPSNPSLPQGPPTFIIVFVLTVLSCVIVGEECGTRRKLMFQAFTAAVTFPAVGPVALAVESEDFRVYTDDVNKFKISIPQDWQVGNGEGDGVKSLTAFYPPEASSANVSILITGLGADFTRLESFGKVDEFAETLIGGLDRSWQRPPGVAAKLVDSKAANGLYYIEYTLQKPGETLRHLFSVLGIADNGFYNRLYTLTGQFLDDEEEKFGPKIRKLSLSKFFDFLVCCFIFQIILMLNLRWLRFRKDQIQNLDNNILSGEEKRCTPG